MYLEFINIDNQKVDIFTKPLDGPRFESLRKTIGVVSFLELYLLCDPILFTVAYLLYWSHMCR